MLSSQSAFLFPKACFLPRKLKLAIRFPGHILCIVQSLNLSNHLHNPYLPINNHKDRNAMLW
jgi:hypothetical protein